LLIIVTWHATCDDIVEARPVSWLTLAAVAGYELLVVVAGYQVADDAGRCPLLCSCKAFFILDMCRLHDALAA